MAPSSAQEAEILVADDEPAILEGVKALLESEGYLVRTARDGEEALRMCRERLPDLLLLDVMMPRLGGYAVCREVRRDDANLPIIFLTARDADADELLGLSSGADGYIPKAAAQAVMLARIAAALRRARPVADPAVFEFGSCRVNAAQMRIFPPDGASHEVTPREVAMLRFFLSRPGEVVSRDSLLTRFWGLDFDGGDAVLTVALHRLRGKLGADARLIRTVPRQGYRYEA